MKSRLAPAAHAAPSSRSTTHNPEEEPALRYFARQPILNAQNQVFGYELLFRSGPANGFSGDGELATRAMLDNSLLYGFERLTGGLPAFINCTLESLTSRIVEVLPPALTVLEVLETLDPTPALVTACRKLSAHGYAIALDDFLWRPELEPLIDIADYIKVDMRQCDAEARCRLMKEVRGRRVRLLAEKVETQAEFDEARGEGFTLFQGYYFCKPVIVESNEIPSNKISQLEMLRALQSNGFEPRRLARLVERDAAITYRLLRLVNSPLYAIRHEIHTVEAALLAVGEATFRRVAVLAVATALCARQPVEVVRMALARARFCELAAPMAELDPGEQYLLGMFSLLPAMLQVSMEQAVQPLGLPDPMRRALMGEPVDARMLLRWLESSEQAEWAECELIERAARLEPARLARYVAEAVTWTEATLRAAA